ncbi:hypothetical protein EDC94DRAFT_611291 [Helicostylum pulchrum]|uniref:Methyltransferase domain-containing protein n=1 Tax=Helicostylum pulchrum TaxID=562976 RepID=A0ABP9Y6P3_9FUNG|nr:hypothetical protein EDC94DRAFT_611291 [Helicostylum pulchrum]
MGNQLSRRRRNLEKSSTSSSTYSDNFQNSSNLSTAVPKFVQEVFPHSYEEATRQRGEHYLLKHVFQSSHFAPVDDILNELGSETLDVGCGVQASWLLDMANDFPNCTFYGFDILEPFSLDTDTASVSHIPTNCELIKHDVFETFPYKDKTFDYVHQRTMHMVYSSDKIAWMFQQLLRVTKDNGWIELVEPDITPRRVGPIFTKVFIGVRTLLRERLGKTLEGSSIAKRMEAVGLLDITSDYGSVPVCWGGYVGKLVYEDMLVMFKHIGPAAYDYLELGGEYNEEAYDALLDSAFDECVQYQTFFNIRWTYGRKPPTTTITTTDNENIAKKKKKHNT